MATTYNVRYKNHCTPQAQVISGGRYYLDSDCGRKLTGDCSAQAIANTGNYEASKAVTATGSECEIVTTGNNYEFVFIKNTGSAEIHISLTGDATAKYIILLSKGEAFASEIDTSAVVKVKCAADEDSTIEYFVTK